MPKKHSKKSTMSFFFSIFASGLCPMAKAFPKREKINYFEI